MGTENDETIVLPPSPLLNGRYLLGRQLGEGGFGSVYLAHDQTMHQRPVVVKIQLNPSLDDPWFERKFSEEVRALSLIDHPGVVSAIDSGRTPDGKPFLVMQYVDGVTLRTVMSPDGMPIVRAAEILKQIGHALAAAHEKGIWHRDLKPENLMLQRMTGGGERVRLIDFGIATVADLAANLTTTRVSGTVLYMAPEQRLGRPSAAADIYAMGLIAYEMLTGRKPFNSDDAGQIMALQQAGVRLKPSDLRPAITPVAERLILQSLAFDPAKRPVDAREFGDELYQSLIPSEMTRITAPVEPAPVEPAPKPKRNNKRLMVLGAVLLSIAAVKQFRHPESPAPVQPEPVVIASPPRVTPPDHDVEDLPKPKADPDPDLEKEIWNVTKKSSEAEVYQAYLDRYPKGKHASAARKKLESLRKNDERNEVVREKLDIVPEITYWTSIQKRNQPAGYREYLAKYPNGKFAKIAQFKLGLIGPSEITKSK